MPLQGDKLAASIENAERVKKAIQLRHAGYSWDDIATECGWASRGAAYTQVKRANEHALSEMHEEVGLWRLQGLERYRELIKALWDRRFDEKVAMAIMRIQERIDRLTGAEQPIRFDWGESDVDRALRDIDEEFRRRAARTAGEAVPPA